MQDHSFHVIKLCVDSRWQDLNFLQINIARYNKCLSFLILLLISTFTILTAALRTLQPLATQARCSPAMASRTKQKKSSTTTQKPETKKCDVSGLIDPNAPYVDVLSWNLDGLGEGMRPREVNSSYPFSHYPLILTIARIPASWFGTGGNLRQLQGWESSS